MNKITTPTKELFVVGGGGRECGGDCGGNVRIALWGIQTIHFSFGLRTRAKVFIRRFGGGGEDISALPTGAVRGPRLPLGCHAARRMSPGLLARSPASSLCPAVRAIWSAVGCPSTYPYEVSEVIK